MEGRVGPFRLLEVLGQGGMGAVYRARSEEDGRLVALKLVRSPRAGMLESLRREIRALARLRHPGIVRILGEGVREGMPWYAMELLEGVTLRRFRAPSSAAATEESGAETPEAGRCWTQSLEAPETLELLGSSPAEAGTREELEAAGIPAEPRAALGLARRLCFALAYLHGEGLVHRDLKPDNILVRSESQGGPSSPPCFGGLPVLVDFGLASSSGAELSREALEVAGVVSGTVAYMAPEQARGELVDARADLYALGCILYEMVAGRPPFVGTTPLQVLRQHLEVAPRPPSEFAPWLGAELERLILRLLEKEPRQRLGYADDVASALGRLGLGGEAPAGAPPARAYLYRPGFSGRREALDRLEAGLAALGSGRGGMLLLGGESGVGKTRLLVELSRLATRRRLRVLTGECPPTSSAPLQAFRKALRSVVDRCREQGAEETLRLLGGRARVLGAYEPELWGLPGAGAEAPPAELPPRDALLRLYHALAETLATLAAGAGGLLLLLDDLQWSDELSLGALEFLARVRGLAELPLLVVGVYRAEECGAALRELAEAPEVGSLRLERLGGREVGSIVADMLGLGSPPEGFSRFLLRQSEGNPFFVAEYLRAAVGQKLLYRDEAGHWQVAEPGEDRATERTYAALPLPGSLLELVGGRLSRLSPDALRLVEALSVLGREAEVGLLAEVSGLGGERSMNAALEALSRQVLEAAEGDRLRFAHDKLREVAYARLAEEARRGLHRAAAEAIGRPGPEPIEERAAALAHHWREAGRPDLARPHYLLSARHEARRHAHAEAERQYRAYLSLTELSTQESVEARFELAESVLRVQGRLQPAEAELRTALSEAVEMGHRPWQARVSLVLGLVLNDRGQAEAARACYEEALRIARETGQPSIERKSLASLARFELECGRIREGEALALATLDMAREHGDRGIEGAILGNLGLLRRREGRLSEAQAFYAQSIALFQAEADRGAVASVLRNLGSLFEQMGRPEEARRVFHESLAISREIGSHQGEAMLLGCLAHMDSVEGHFEEARRLYAEAFEAAQRSRYPIFEGWLLQRMAALERLGWGELDRSGQLLRASERLLRETREQFHLAGMLCEQGRLALARGESAARFLGEARSIDESLRLGASGPAIDELAKLERAQAAFEAGEWERLFRGELLEDLPEEVRRWLIERGQLNPGRAEA